MAHSLFFLLILVAITHAHMSIYIPSMWGSEPGNPNANWAVQPLQDYAFVDWWMHGTRSLNDPPPANAITILPAGGIFDFEITGNKRYTSMGDGLWVKPGSTNRSVPDPWSNDMGGYGSSNIHAPTRGDVAGCAIGIAYKSEITAVQPNDFVIISVAPDCVARQLQTFDIPALPACPNGKCICSWFWVHKSAGGTDQIYMTPFQCNIANPTTNIIGTPSAPIRCDGAPPCYLDASRGSRASTCAKVLNPIYWANKEGNNIDNPTNFQCAPIYNSSYGYVNGAQHQIFTNVPAAPAGSRGDTLFSTDSLLSSSSTFLLSATRRARLVVQLNGDVQLIDTANGNAVRWSSNTGGQGVAPYRLTIQSDGNLVLYDSTGSPKWSSNTAGKGVAPYRLKLRDPNKISIVDSNSTPLWSN